MRESGLDRLVGLAFWTLGVLCLLNLNDLAGMWIGAERAFSVPILICCVVALAGLVRSDLREALGLPGALILSSLVAYTGIGIVVAILGGTALQSDASWYLTRHAGSILVILAAAVGGRVLWLRVGGDRVLLGLLLILTASCTLMLASPWLWDIFRNPPPEGAYRYFGSFSDPNEAALVACLTAVTALAALRRGRSHILVYGALLVAVAALVGTFSRTAIVILPVLVLSALLVSRGAQRKRLAGGAAIIGLVLLGGFANLDLDQIDERQIARLDSLSGMVELSAIDDVSLAGRATLWRLALDQALESPLFGNGLGSLHHLEGAWYNHDGILLGAHNQYLILLGEAGFVPLILFASFLLVMFHAGFWKEKALWALGAVSGWALVLTLFSLAFHGILTQRACNFIMGLSCAVMVSCLRDEGPPTGPTPAS